MLKKNATHYDAFKMKGGMVGYIYKLEFNLADVLLPLLEFGLRIALEYAYVFISFFETASK